MFTSENEAIGSRNSSGSKIWLKEEKYRGTVAVTVSSSVATIDTPSLTGIEAGDFIHIKTSVSSELYIGKMVSATTFNVDTTDLKSIETGADLSSALTDGDYEVVIYPSTYKYLGISDNALQLPPAFEVGKNEAGLPSILLPTGNDRGITGSVKSLDKELIAKLTGMQAIGTSEDYAGGELGVSDIPFFRIAIVNGLNQNKTQTNFVFYRGQILLNGDIAGAPAAEKMLPFQIVAQNEGLIKDFRKNQFASFTAGVAGTHEETLSVGV